MKQKVNNFLCFLFGHKYRMDIYYSASMQKIKCTRCCKKFGINHFTQSLLDWDSELEEAANICHPKIAVNETK